MEYAQNFYNRLRELNKLVLAEDMLPLVCYDCTSEVVDVVMNSEDTITDCDDGSAVIVESIYEAMAQMFIEQHKKNVKRGLDHNAARCLYNGQKTLGYIG